MIFFCEDCGEKNDLTPEHLKQGKAVFRCRVCNYSNSYRITPPKETPPESVDSFFTEIKLFPEIIGSFLFHKKKGLLKNDMPGTLKKKDLAILGKLLADSLSICCMEYPDVEEMTLMISNKSILVKMIDVNLAVILVGNSSHLPQNIITRLARFVSDQQTQH